MAWGDRAKQLPPNWEKGIRPRILRRDPVCKAQGCSSPSTEVDHIQRGNDHRDTNLQGLCSYHHRQKSLAEAAAARWAPNKRTTRQTEKHPGLR